MVVVRNHFASVSLLAIATTLACSSGAEEPGRVVLPDGSGNASESQEALAKPALSKTEERTALKLIDDICGDTWCEGDHNFRFDRLTCQAACGKTPGTCKLAFKLFPHGATVAEGPTYSRTCQTQGFKGFASLVDTAANGYQSLNWDFYLALSDCINRIERALPVD